MTGESRLVEKGEGNPAIGGSVNGEGSITVEVQKTGGETYLAQVIDLVRKARNPAPGRRFLEHSRTKTPTAIAC